MIELRPHHLLCMLTFAGKGYSERFVDKFRSVAAQINNGAFIRIVPGPDELCACVVADDAEPHCFKASVTARDKAAAADVGNQLGFAIEPGVVFRLSKNDIARMHSWFRNGVIRRACTDCQWHDLCTELAADQFVNCMVKGT